MIALKSTTNREAVATMGVRGDVTHQGKILSFKNKAFWPCRGIPSAKFANLPANRRLYAYFVGKFVLNTPENKTHIFGPEKH